MTGRHAPTGVGAHLVGLVDFEILDVLAINLGEERGSQAGGRAVERESERHLV